MGRFCYKIYINKFDFKTYTCWDFPGCSVVKNPCFHCKGTGSISGWGTKIPHAMHPKINIEKHKMKSTKQEAMLWQEWAQFTVKELPDCIRVSRW